MMSRMQDTSPENPDALTRYVEEWNYRKPPVFILRGKKREPRARQFNHARRVIRRRALLGHDFGSRWLGQSQKLGKETPLGKQLVLDDFADATRSCVRFKR